MNQHFQSVGVRDRPCAAPTRLGMSLVEVMCAIIVIVVALLTAIGQMQIVNNTTTSAADQARVQEIGRSLLDRIVGARPVDLGTSAIVWTMPRFEDGSVGLPLTETSSVATDNLLTQQLIQQRSGLTNLRVFVEYYRGLQDTTVSPSLKGVMDATFANAHDFSVKFQNATFRSDRKLNTTLPLITQVAAENPIVIRLILTWNPGQRLELYTVKRRPTS